MFYDGANVNKEYFSMFQDLEFRIQAELCCCIEYTVGYPKGHSKATLEGFQGCLGEHQNCTLVIVLPQSILKLHVVNGKPVEILSQTGV